MRSASSSCCLEIPIPEFLVNFKIDFDTFLGFIFFKLFSVFYRYRRVKELPFSERVKLFFVRKIMNPTVHRAGDFTFMNSPVNDINVIILFAPNALRLSLCKTIPRKICIFRSISENNQQPCNSTKIW